MAAPTKPGRDAAVACSSIAALVSRKTDLVTRQKALKKVEKALDRAFERLDGEEQREIRRG
jgi:hypothetical protein